MKPANIKITPAGAVKVLDFGVATVTATRADSSHAPTVPIGGTHEGLILGTTAYMSPERARGEGSTSAGSVTSTPHPFWSSDSRSIGFFADAKLKRFDVTGGAAWRRSQRTHQSPEVGPGTEMV